MLDQLSVFAVILLLAAVTFATRVGGVVIMSHVTITPRIEAFLKYMATSVLISIVVPAALASAPRIWLAVATAAAAMLLTRSMMGGMLAGVLIAAIGRYLGV